MKLLLPVFVVLDISVLPDRQQCLLKEAKDVKARQYKPYETCGDNRLRDPKTAFEEGNISAFPVLEA